MTQTTFLAELEGLTHHQRMQRMMELGRAARTEPAAQARIAALHADPDAYVRTLAVATLPGSGDGQLALTLLGDPSRIVRRRAGGMIAQVCTDEQAALALEWADTPRERTRIASSLRRTGRLVPIDAFFSRPFEDPSRIEALPFASSAVIEHEAETFVRRAGTHAWSRAASLHPAWVVGRVAKELGEDPAGALARDPRMRWRIQGVTGALTKRDPTPGLVVLRLLLGAGEPPSRVPSTLLARLLRSHPCETFDLLRAHHESTAPQEPPGSFRGLRLDKIAHRLGPERLAFLVTHAWSTLKDGVPAKRWFLRLGEADRHAVVEAWLDGRCGSWGGFLLRHVPAESPRRAEAFARWSTAARDSEGVIAVAVLATLPADLRQLEARRHLEMKVLSTRFEARYAYAALLPFQEAARVLASWLGHPEGEERAKAIRPLIATVRFEPSSLAALFVILRARIHEQDPVRLAMLASLAALPAAHFEPAHLVEVGVLLRGALDASDLSVATAQAAERLVIGLFRNDAEWAAAWLGCWIAERGVLRSRDLHAKLLPTDVEILGVRLEDMIRSWITRERETELLGLASSLGLRLPHAPALVEALASLAGTSTSRQTVESALELIRAWVPRRFAELAPQLVKNDPSVVFASSVATFVSVYRQDLLPPLLASTRMTGRFATGDTHWLLRFPRGGNRWTSRQQRTHAGSWAGVVTDPKRDVPAVLRALDALAELSFAPPAALLAATDDPRPAVREAAVRALPRLDAGQGLLTLLECLDGARARWAIYALRRVFAEMAPNRVLAHLREVSSRQITVVKEVVRLLGTLTTPEAYAELVAYDLREDLHRDVRIALLRAFWDHLDHETTWEAFDRAVADPDWVVASKLADLPLERLAPDHTKRVTALLVRLLQRPEPEARLGLLGRAAALPLVDAERMLFLALVERLGAETIEEACAAARAVRGRLLPEDVPAVLARLVSLAPRRELVAALVPVFAVTNHLPAQHEAVAEGLVSMLAADPLAVPQYLELVAARLDWQLICAVLEDLAQRDWLHVDAMVAAYRAVAVTVHPALLEARLGRANDPRLRRLGLEALKRAVRPKEGWSTELRTKLATYRSDPSPLVAGAAAYVFLPEG